MKSPLLKFLKISAAFFVSLVIVLLILKTPLDFFIKSITYDNYKLVHNYCPQLHLNNSNIYLYFYLLIVFAVLFAVLTGVRGLFKISIAPAVGFMVFFLLLGLQTVNQTKFLLEKHEDYADKNYDKKRELIFGKQYEFVEFCQRYLADCQRGELITDHDNSKSLEAYFISYFLYPKTDIFLDKSRPTECVVVFEKQNPAEFVPDGFRVLANYNERNLVAVKERVNQ